MQELGRFLDSAARESSGKEVFMYCTGGIRCEKAAIYLEKKAPDVAKVYQLQGGIHEYLEAYGGSEECLFLGKNFTFDKRGVMPKSGKVDCDGEVWNQSFEAAQFASSADSHSSSASGVKRRRRIAASGRVRTTPISMAYTPCMLSLI